MNTATSSNNTSPRIALITGGSRGLGKNAALHLARQGVGILFTYVGNRTAADATVSEIEALGVPVAALQLDLADSASFTAFAQQVSDALYRHWQASQFNYLVNNGGMGIYGAIAETSEADFDALYKVHLKGPFFLTQALLPLLADGGRIINISSGLARFTLPGYGAYAAMKGGVEVMTRYMAKEFGARGIAVNTVAPGAIETDFGGGRVGLPDDIGAAIASLLREDNGWINAQRVEVSGGFSI